MRAPRFRKNAAVPYWAGISWRDLTIKKPLIAKNKSQPMYPDARNTRANGSYERRRNAISEVMPSDKDDRYSSHRIKREDAGIRGIGVMTFGLDGVHRCSRKPRCHGAISQSSRNR